MPDEVRYRLTVARRLENLYQMREDGEISGEEFKTRRAKYQSELTAIDTVFHTR